MGSDFSCKNLINKLLFIPLASLLMTGCVSGNTAKSSDEIASETPETLTSFSSLSSSEKYQKGFKAEEKALMEETLQGVVLPFAYAPSYRLEKETVSSVEGITYELTSDYYLSLKASYFAALQEASFALINTEIDDLDPYYIARKTLAREVHVDVNFLVEEGHLKAFAYLYDNSRNVYERFPNEALKDDLGYTLPEFGAKYYVVSYGLTSDYRYLQVDIQAEEISADLAHYQPLLATDGFTDFTDGSDYLMAVKGPVKILVYVEGNSALIRTSSTDKPAKN